jgi:hypothetical protein
VYFNLKKYLLIKYVYVSISDMLQTQLRATSSEVSAIPLTEVGVRYGTAGLQERFEHDLDKIDLQDSEREFILASAELGTQLHEGQRRTYEPYVNHLLRVAIRLMEMGVTDPVILAAAPVHDGPEDQPARLARRLLNIEVLPTDPHALRELGHRAVVEFASRHQARIPEVARLPGMVYDVSTPVRRPDDDKNAVYHGHVGRILRTGRPGSSVLKLADLKDNMEAPPLEAGEDPRKRAQMDHKQAPVYQDAEAALMRPDSLVVGLAQERALAELALLQAQAAERLGYNWIDTLPADSLRSA